MEAVFAYVIALGAAVMMPIIFLILGLCIGLGFNKSLMSGLKVGVGFVGLGIVTALLTSSMTDPLKAVTDIYELQLKVFDMGWPAAASVAYNTAVGAFIIPVCLGVNILLLLIKGTRTVNIDLWNYWHYAFIGGVVYFATAGSVAWGFFAAIICYIVTLVIADVTAPKFQKFYKDVDGISIPQPFCAGFAPFAWLINKILDFIPGFDKYNIDADGLKKKFGIFYINSTTAHKAYKTQLISIDGRKGTIKANRIYAGSLEESNDRIINQLIVNNVLEGGPCQLQMGLTELMPGSVWNTMPCHIHDRRVEAYFYFNVPDGNAICHLMGEPQQTRVVWLHNEQAIMSPEWSIHSAAGTSNYMFIWGMGGENLDYGDQDKVKVEDLK